MSTTQTPRRSPHMIDAPIRWLIRRDMRDVLRIEDESFDCGWTEEDFLCCLRQRNCIGMVAEHNHSVVGFMIYELHKAQFNVLNLAVDPQYRNCGVGTQMMDRLIDKLVNGANRRTRIELEVRERNLPAQLFFQKCGFRAEHVVRDGYENPTEDLYVMRYRIAGSGHTVRPSIPVDLQP